MTLSYRSQVAQILAPLASTFLVHFDPVSLFLFYLHYLHGAYIPVWRNKQ